MTTTVEHPFHVAGQGFTRAISLNPGDRLTTPEGTTPLQARGSLTDTTQVYNLNIDNTHTYYAEPPGVSVLVHNVNASDPCGESVGKAGEIFSRLTIHTGKQDKSYSG